MEMRIWRCESSFHPQRVYDYEILIQEANNTLECSSPLALSELPISQCFFYWRIVAKFRPGKYDFDSYKRLCDVTQNSPNFEGLFVFPFFFFFFGPPNRQIFYDNLQQCIAKNRQGFFFSFFNLLSCLVCSQNWLKKIISWMITTLATSQNP
jgi:hypothetical protein